MKKVHAATLLAAIAMAFAPLSQSNAASLAAAVSNIKADSQIVLAKHHHHGPGRCGENMFWKHGHCMDARNKSA
jgi:uncharacterized low-complexity protein